MTDKTDAIQTILSDAHELLNEKFRELGVPDTPFVLIAVAPANQMIVAGNLDPMGLKLLGEDLGEIADEVDKRPANNDAIH